MLRRGTTPRRLQIARATGVPSPVVRLADELSSGTLRGRPTYLVALGHNVAVGQNLDNYPRPAYGPTLDQKIAKLIVEARHLVARGDPNYVDAAYQYGELTALHAFPNSAITADMVTEARQVIETIVQQHCPPGDAIARVVTELRNQIANAPDTRITKEEFIQRTGFTPAECTEASYPEQKALYFETRMNCLAVSTLLNAWTDDYIEVWNNLDNLGNSARQRLPVGPVPAVVADPRVIWTDLTPELRLAMYESCGATDKEDHRRYLICSGLVYCITMIKGPNFTDAWLNRFVGRFDARLQHYNLVQNVSRDVVQCYQDLYPRTNLDTDQLYSVLSGVYNILRDEDTAPIQWIIEQSSAQNISSAQALATAFLKSPYIPYNILERIIGREEFAALVRLACWLYHDKFATLIRPMVTMAEYPDLAYLGVQISFRQNGGKVTKYAGNTADKCKLPVSELNEIANLLTTLATEGTRGRFDLGSIAKEIYAQDAIHEIQGRVFRIPHDAAAAAPAGPALQGDGVVNEEVARRQAEAAQEAADRRVQLEAASRMGWPRAAKQLPAGALEVEVGEVCTKGRDSLNPMWAGFERFLNIIRAAGEQHPLEIFALTRINPTQRKKVIPADILNLLPAWNITPEPEWTAPPAPIPPIAPRENDDLSNYYVLHRIAPGRVGAGQPDPGNEDPQGQAQ